MKKGIAGVFLGLIMLLSACTSTGEGPSGAPDESVRSSEPEGGADSAYHKITAEEAKDMLDKGDVILVDVRTEKEYEQGHIPGAVLVPNESIGDEPPEALPDKDAVLLVYCRTGVRSRQASDKLVGLGYTQVYDFGGIVDWPYETER